MRRGAAGYSPDRGLLRDDLLWVVEGYRGGAILAVGSRSIFFFFFFFFFFIFFLFFFFF